MKRFFFKCLIYSGILLLSSALFLRVLVSFPNEYCLQSHEVNVIRQIERMKTIDEPKIVIIGGSGCGFGLCSKMISEHFNMPVCNTSTHAGIGLLTQLNLFKEYICKDDIVIVIPEYSNYISKNGYLGNVTNLRILSSTYPKGYKTFSLRQQLYLLQHVPSAFNDAWKSRKVVLNDDSPYSEKSLNVFGDVEKYEVREHDVSKNWVVERWEKPIIPKRVISILQEYDWYCKNKGAVMLVFPQAYRAACFDANKEFIDSIWVALDEALLPLSSFPEDYKVPDSLCFDGDGHFTYEGVIFRTNQLIKDMDSALCIYRDC